MPENVSLFKSVAENWEIITGSMTAFCASIVLAFKIGKDKKGTERTLVSMSADIEKLKENQLKVLKAMPRNVMDGSDSLSTRRDCIQARSECGVHALTEELMGTMHIVKQAVSLLIVHNKEIPQSDRDKAIRELVR